MKTIYVTLFVFLSGCATRHVPEPTTWFADCYNKTRIESMLAQSESQLSANEFEKRRKIRKVYWDLQKECQ
jgi:hypothetical protein